jgi:hypothetical protein
MLLRHRGRTSRAAIAAAAVAAVATAGAAVAPAHAATSLGSRPPSAALATGTSTAVSTAASTAGPAATPSTRVVTLLTGDRVVVRTDASGRSLASFTPRSPHARDPYRTAVFGGHQYVVPKLPASQLRRFDPSVFDVAALAGQPRQTLDVTFARGATSRSLPGLTLRPGTARRCAAGRTTVQATYDAARPLPSGFAAALGSVARIGLHGVSAPQADPAYQLHPLTINATDAHGDPMDFALVSVFNLDDGRLFGAFGEIVDGQWKVQVPTGHYVVLVDNFSRAAVGQADVQTDATATVSMADATVKPSMRYPGHSVLSPEVDLIFQDAAGTSSASFGYGGAMPRLTPVSHLDAGRVDTEVSNQWSTKGWQPFSFDHGRFVMHPVRTIATAKESRPGIPSRLAFSYDDRDFAVVQQRSYATGGKVESFTGWAGLTQRDRFLFFSAWATARPGTVTSRFLASRSTRWLTDSQLTTGFRHFADLSSLRSYPRPRHSSEPFFRGPLTPVVDRGLERNGSGPACALCVKDGKLRGVMPMLTSAGTSQSGYADLGRWQLQGPVTCSGSTCTLGTALARGRGMIVPQDVPLPPGAQLTLRADTRREDDSQRLSTQVQDSWGFRAPAVDGAVPILRADYVPPTNLGSVGRPGTVRFPITFDNLGPEDSRVVSADLRYSTGAGTWRNAHLQRRDQNTFVVSYPQPVAGKRRYLSLRVDARDAHGRSLSEVVANAYVLPKAGAGGARHHATTAAAVAHRTFRPHRICSSPDRAAYSCFLSLDARTLRAGRASPDPQGWGAPAIRDAYDVPSTGAGTTVAVVVAYDYPTAEADMNRYRSQFGLPACTSASGCFTKINQRGETGSYPAQDVGWGVEASLDLQMISTACPTCKIVLAEANQPTDRAFNKTTRAAAAAGATVTNHSYGRIELTGDDTADGAYALPGVTAVSASGDYGYGPAQFPASSPHVVAVGGTTLRRTVDGRGWEDRVWDGTGSGCSAYFAKPAWQSDAACPGRTATDVSAVAHGIAVFNTSIPRPYAGWIELDGTSASSPLVAGLIGEAGSGGISPDVLYAHAADFNDVVAGRNGFCLGSYLCTGVAGYDAPTGLGTPEGVAGFQAP